MARRVPPHPSYYICTGKFRQGRQRTGSTCTARFIPSQAIDGLVWRDLCELLQHPQVVAEAFRHAAGGAWLPQEFQACRENLRRGRESLDQQLERLTDAYLGGVIPLSEYRHRRGVIEGRRAALVEQEQRLSGEASRLDDLLGLVASLEAFCERVSSGLRDATFDQKRELVELLIDRVVVTGDGVEIRYVFPTDPRSEHIRFCHLRSDYFVKVVVYRPSC